MTVLVVIDMPVKKSGAEEDGEYYWDGERQRGNSAQRRFRERDVQGTREVTTLCACTYVCARGSDAEQPAICRQINPGCET